MDKIPVIVFKMRGTEVFRMPAHLLLIVRSFQDGAILAPDVGMPITLEVRDGATIRVWNFDMPDMSEHTEH